MKRPCEHDCENPPSNRNSERCIYCTKRVNYDRFIKGLPPIKHVERFIPAQPYATCNPTDDVIAVDEDGNREPVCKREARYYMDTKNPLCNLHHERGRRLKLNDFVSATVANPGGPLLKSMKKKKRPRRETRMEERIKSPVSDFVRDIIAEVHKWEPVGE